MTPYRGQGFCSDKCWPLAQSRDRAKEWGQSRGGDSCITPANPAIATSETARKIKKISDNKVVTPGPQTMIPPENTLKAEALPKALQQNRSLTTGRANDVCTLTAGYRTVLVNTSLYSPSSQQTKKLAHRWPKSLAQGAW